MKKLVARVLVLILACIWTRRVAKGKDLQTLPQLKEGVVEMTFKEPWEFQGLPKVTGLEKFICSIERECEKPYLKVVEHLLSDCGIKGDEELTLENVKKITEMALGNNWIIPVGRVKDGNKYATLLFPILEGATTLDEALKEAALSTKKLEKESGSRFVDYVSIEEQLQIAQALVQPLDKLHEFGAYHGNVNNGSIVVVHPKNAGAVAGGFKLLKKGTKLLLKEFKVPSFVATAKHGCFDAFGVAMIFGDFITEDRSKIDVFFGASSAETADAVSHYNLFGRVRATGAYNRTFSFWKDYVKFSDMSQEMKAMWVFATLAALPGGQVSFKESTRYLTVGVAESEVDKWVDELWKYSERLEVLGSDERWEDAVIKYLSGDDYYYLSARVVTAKQQLGVLRNAFYKFGRYIPMVHRMFTYTNLFSAAEDELPIQTVSGPVGSVETLAKLQADEQERFRKRINLSDNLV
eukprot:GHVS01050483.1.p1 GENE.GHVS01050483.1~~GHVS01050483.1.p1  ORF type:complete len:465 (+),score=53.34 GHVS01050483.1:132-1526(+)